MFYILFSVTWLNNFNMAVMVNGVHSRTRSLNKKLQITRGVSLSFFNILSFLLSSFFIVFYVLLFSLEQPTINLYGEHSLVPYSFTYSQERRISPFVRALVSHVTFECSILGSAGMFLTDPSLNMKPLVRFCKPQIYTRKSKTQLLISNWLCLGRFPC